MPFEAMFWPKKVWELFEKEMKVLEFEVVDETSWMGYFIEE